MSSRWHFIVEFDMDLPDSYDEDGAEEFVAARIPFPQHTMVEGTQTVVAQRPAK